MFLNRKVSKLYWAVTVGVPTYEEGQITIPVGEAKVGEGFRIAARRDLVGKPSHVCTTGLCTLFSKSLDSIASYMLL